MFVCGTLFVRHFLLSYLASFGKHISRRKSVRGQQSRPTVLDSRMNSYFLGRISDADRFATEMECKGGIELLLRRCSNVRIAAVVFDLNPKTPY